MRIVGLVGVATHAIGERGIDGVGDDARTHHACFRLAAQRADVFVGVLSRQQVATRDDGRERIDQMNLGARHDHVWQRFFDRAGDIFAQHGHGLRYDFSRVVHMRDAPGHW